MGEKKHERLEELKALLNFKDDGPFQHYSNGYKQAEEDCRIRMENALANLDQKLGIQHEHLLAEARARGRELLAAMDQYFGGWKTCAHDWEPNTVMTYMRCERCGVTCKFLEAAQRAGEGCPNEEWQARHHKAREALRALRDHSD